MPHRSQHCPVPRSWHGSSLPQHGHVHGPPEPRGSVWFHNTNHQYDALSLREREALAADKALKQSTRCSIKYLSHMLIIIIFCSQIVPFIWWAQPTNLAWIWSGVCLEVCFDLKITLKLCLELFLRVHVGLCVPVHMDRNSWYFSTEHHRPSASNCISKLGKKKKGRDILIFLLTTAVISLDSSSSERDVPFPKAVLTQQVFEFPVSWCLNILPCQIRTKKYIFI